MTTATAPSVNSQLRDKAIEIKDNLVDLAGIARDAARDTCAEVKDAASVRYQAGVEKAGKARDGIVDFVQEHPGKSLIACAVVGALAGFLISRRR